MIEIRNLHKKYGKLEVLRGIDLDFRKEGIFAVLGPNGSGKTTLIKSILGMVIHEKGEILIRGQKIKNKYYYRNDINYLPQIARFPSNLRVEELINMIEEIRPKSSKKERLIEAFGLQSFLKQKLGNLSGGTKQKVNLVLTFMFDSPILILDEPTTGLDPISLIYLKQLIREERAKGKTILITSHIMSFVEEIADEIIFLLDGKIYFNGSVKRLKDETDQVDLEHAIAKIIANE